MLYYHYHHFYHYYHIVLGLIDVIINISLIIIFIATRLVAYFFFLVNRPENCFAVKSSLFHRHHRHPHYQTYYQLLYSFMYALFV